MSGKCFSMPRNVKFWKWAKALQDRSIYLSIYQAIISLKGDSQDKACQGSWRHYSPIPFCLFVGEYTDESLP